MILLVAVVAGCSAGSPLPQQSGLSAARSGGGVPARLVGRYHLSDAGVAVAMTGNADGLWLAVRPPPSGLATAPGAGQLERIVPDSGAVVGRWPIGGSPVVVAASAQSVWVADGPGAGPATATGGNEVLQFTTSGQPVLSYPVTNPLELVADADAAVVAYQQPSGTYVQRLAGGVADPAVKLAGADRIPGVALVRCADQRLWAASFDDRTQRLHLQQFAAVAGQPLQDLHSDTVLAVSGATSLACQPHGLAALVAELDHATLILVPRDAPASPPRVATVAPTGVLVGTDAQRLWLIRERIYPSRDVQVQVVNVDDLTTGSPISFPGAANLYTATSTGLWTVDRDPSSTQAALTHVTTP